MFCWIWGCDQRTDPSKGSCTGGSSLILQDRSLPDFQLGLLKLAFEAASSIPLEPHIKDRCRTQQAVVEACLKLDQPQRALTYLEQISDWRRGLAYAELALYAVQHGAHDQGRSFLLQSLEISDWNDLEKGRIDQIRGRIARVYYALGESEKGQALEVGLEPFAFREFSTIPADPHDPDTFESWIHELDRHTAGGDFDHLRRAAKVYVQLLDRYYSDPKPRSRIIDKLQECLILLPMMARIEVLMESARVSVRHQDPIKALETIEQAQRQMGGAQWRPEHRVALMAGLAALRHQAGQTKEAMAELEMSLSFYNDNRNRIADIYRAEALRQLAQAHNTIGNQSIALTLYKRAVEEGVENPNSRPRAEDLSATCISMTLGAIEPDDALWSRLHQIVSGLGSPW